MGSEMCIRDRLYGEAAQGSMGKAQDAHSIQPCYASDYAGIDKFGLPICCVDDKIS